MKKEFIGLLEKPVSKWTKAEYAYLAKLFAANHLKINTSSLEKGLITRAIESQYLNAVAQKVIDPAHAHKNLLPKKKVGRPGEKFKDVSAHSWFVLIEDIRDEIAKKKATNQKVTDREVAQFLAKGLVKDNKLTPPRQKEREVADVFVNDIKYVNKHLKNKGE